jgi:hypothetical protein
LIVFLFDLVVLSIRAVICWTVLSFALVTSLAFPTSLVERFSRLVTATTSLSKRRSFGISRSDHSCFAVFVEKMWRLLASLWTMIVTSREIVLKVHLQFSVLSATLAQEGA